MEDRWHLAATSFHRGSLTRASEHLQALLSDTPLSQSLLRSLHQINNHALSVASNVPDPPPPPSLRIPPAPASPQLRLLAAEAALTAAYNSALAQLPNSNPAQARVLLDHAIANSSHNASWIAADLYREPSAASARRRLKPTLPDVCEQLRIFADTITTSPDSFAALPFPLSAPIARWSVAAAAALELRAAAALHTTDPTTARATATAAAALRSLAAAEHARTPPNPQMDVQMDDVQLDGNETPLNCQLPERNLPLDAAQADKLDEEAARADWLLALSHAVAGDVSSARTAIDARASEASSPSSAFAFLPAAYLSGALCALSGDELDKDLLHTCAARGHRTADCLALLARCEKGADAVSAWSRTVAVDYKRPAALWLAAREFAQVGRPRQQAELLLCLEELLGAEGGEGRNEGMLPVGDIVRGGRNGLSVMRVRAARARALYGAGEFREAIDMLKELQRELSSCASVDMPPSLAQDIALDLGCALVSSGDVDEGIPLLEVASVAVSAEWRRAGAALARAEGLLRTEHVDEALGAVREAVRCLRVGESDECAALRLLRGVSFHNLAVLRLCREGSGSGVDEAFAAAQAAFQKCCGEEGTGVEREARRMAEAASLGRCLAMWSGGRKTDAAGHWVAKRGEKERVGEDGGRREIVSHVMTEVPAGMISRMDKVAGKVWKSMEARRRLREVVEEVTEKWTMSEE